MNEQRKYGHRTKKKQETNLLFKSLANTTTTDGNTINANSTNNNDKSCKSSFNSFNHVVRKMSDLIFVFINLN